MSLHSLNNLHFRKSHKFKKKYDTYDTILFIYAFHDTLKKVKKERKELL